MEEWFFIVNKQNNYIASAFSSTSKTQQHLDHSEPNSAASTFYFNTTGTPTFYGKGGSIGIEEPSELTDKEIIKKINKVVDEKFWFLEQTTSRYYLSGFRLPDNVKNNNLENNFDEKNNHEIKLLPRSLSSIHSYLVVKLRPVKLERKRRLKENVGLKKT
ncbi:hypothetical protein Glove_350g17 [Diversispora epigaea]|uniref:Uncharacterized protein n=1 Tax=Diversispora epigaea TaxID=1348612 RepID=A0A397HD66_9GLOM|nr:hypothetical protein Glove_350g17 [Diversispora epigaea]